MIIYTNYRVHDLSNELTLLLAWPINRRPSLAEFFGCVGCISVTFLCQLAFASYL